MRVSQAVSYTHLAVGGIDGKNDGLDVVTGLDQLGGMLHAL